MNLSKVLIVIPSFGHGGTNKSLYNLLSIIEVKNYKIDIFCFYHEGYYKNKLPNCTILPPNKLLAFLKKGLFRVNGIWKLVQYLLLVVSKSYKLLTNETLTELLLRRIANRFTSLEYDTIIAFSEGHPTRLVSQSKVVNKIAWIRCDYSSYLNLNKIRAEEHIYKKFDKIICVSLYTAKVFQDLIPCVKDKVSAVYNIINSSSIIEKSKEIENLDKKYVYDGFKIVSIGRMDEIKRFSVIPSIASKIKESNSNFRWYVIGTKESKNESELFFKNLKEYDVSDVVVFLGPKDNPYPYIAESNLLISTSLSEACPNVINEAKILHIPVVSADFGSAKEFVTSEVGFVVKIDKMADILLFLLNDKIAYNNLKNSVCGFNYDNTHSLSLVNNLIR